MSTLPVVAIIAFASYVCLCMAIRFGCGRVLLGHPFYAGVRQVEIPFGRAGVLLVFPYAYVDYKLTGTMWAYRSGGSGKIVGG